MGRSGEYSILGRIDTDRGFPLITVEDRSSGERYLFEEFGFDMGPKKRVLLELIQNLEKRAEGLQQISHSGFLKPIGVEKLEGKHYLVMPVPGEAEPEGYLGKNKTDPQTTVRWMTSIAGAMAAVHRAGKILHGPTADNIVLFRSGDAGLSDPASGEILSGYRPFRIRAENYIPPEMTTGRRWTKTADMFCAGVVFYLMLTGELPFDHPNSHEITKNVLEARPLDPRYHNPAISKEIGGLVERLLEKHPESRIRSGDELVSELRMITEKECFYAPTSEQEAIRKQTGQAITRRKINRIKRTLRERWAWIAGGIAGVLILVSLFRPAASVPTITSRTEPLQVVSLYYQAIDNLDVQLLEEAIEAKAGRNVIRWVTNLYVIERVNLGMNLQSRPLLPQEKPQGQTGVQSPAPSEPDFIKISGLQIKQLTKNDGEVTFEASYALTLPSEGRPATTPHRDWLKLTRVNGKWKITGLREKTQGSLP